MLNGRFLYAGAGWPGCAPAGASLFFASPKQSKQKKGEPDSSALRARCVARSRRGAQKLALRAQTSAPLIRLALRYSPPHNGVGGVQNNQHKYDKDAPWRVLVVSGIRSFAVLTRLSSAGASGSRSARCLSPQGEFARFPLAPSSARNPEGAVSAARLFFGDFLLAKQKKVTAPSGAHPDSRPPQRNPAC